MMSICFIVIISLLALPSLPLSEDGIFNSETASTDNAYISTIQETLSVDYTQSGQYDSIINTIINNSITASMSDFDKAKAIHDYIIINTSYDTSTSIPDSSFSPDGVFLKGIAVCQGYAEAYKLFMDALEIECEVVRGSADNVSHAWNVVKIDGQWYHVDVTWDDPIIENQVLTGTANLTYSYFLKPDEIFYKDHIATSSPPVCSSNTYLYIQQYYNVPYVLLNSVYDIPNVFMEYYKKGVSSLTLYFPENIDPSQTELLTELYKDLYYQTGKEVQFNYYPVERYINYSYITIFIN